MASTALIGMRRRSIAKTAGRLGPMGGAPFLELDVCQWGAKPDAVGALFARLYPGSSGSLGPDWDSVDGDWALVSGASTPAELPPRLLHTITPGSSNHPASGRECLKRIICDISREGLFQCKPCRSASFPVPAWRETQHRFPSPARPSANGMIQQLEL